VNEPTETRILAIRLVQWLEARLDDMVPPRGSVARMYGLEVIDPDGLGCCATNAVRMVFVCEAVDVHHLEEMPEAPRAGDFDAIATVEYRWAPNTAAVARPADFGGRHRERNVRVALRR
jgi:hypothetical protein